MPLSYDKAKHLKYKKIFFYLSRHFSISQNTFYIWNQPSKEVAICIFFLIKVKSNFFLLDYKEIKHLNMDFLLSVILYVFYYLHCVIAYEMMLLSLGLVCQFLQGSRCKFSTTASCDVKFCKTAQEAIKDIPNGAKLLVGGKRKVCLKWTWTLSTLHTWNTRRSRPLKKRRQLFWVHFHTFVKWPLVK